MRKVLSLILVLAVCFGLCACGSTNGSGAGSNSGGQKDPYADVKNALIGSWRGETDAKFYSGTYDENNFETALILTFESDGSMCAHAQLCHKDVGTVATKEYLGTYTISEGKITLNYTSTRDIINSVVKNEASYSGSDSLQYTFQNGTLSVSINGDELKKS